MSRWDDKPLYIIGGGPSLQGFDFSRIATKGRLLGVNDAAFRAPCDAVFNLDQTWHRNRRRQIAEFQGEKWFAAPPNWDMRTEAIPGVTYLTRRRNTGVTDNPEDINGVNSGYGALHLAYHRGAREIYLLGFDMKDDGDRSHWYDRYTWHAREAHARFGKIAASFENMAEPFARAGIRVVNACPWSLIDAFPKCLLEDL